MKLKYTIYTYLKVGTLLGALIFTPILQAGLDDYLKKITIDDESKQLDAIKDSRLIVFIKKVGGSPDIEALKEGEAVQYDEFLTQRVQRNPETAFITQFKLSKCGIENIWEVFYQSLKNLEALEALHLDGNPCGKWRYVDLNEMRVELLGREKGKPLFDSKVASNLLNWITQALSSSDTEEVDKLNKQVKGELSQYQNEDLASYHELIIEALENSKALKVLNLSGCRLGGNITYLLFDYADLPKWRKPNHSLEVINLSGNEIRPLHVSGLRNAGTLYQSLTELDLSENEIDGDATKYVHPLLRHPKLRILKLGANRIDGRGARSLFFAAYSSNEHFEEIDLSDNPIRLNLASVICSGLTDTRFKMPRRVLLKNARLEESAILSILKAALLSKTGRLELLDLRDDALKLNWDKVGKILNKNFSDNKDFSDEMAVEKPYGLSVRAEDVSFKGPSVDGSFNNKGGNAFHLRLGSTKSDTNI